MRTVPLPAVPGCVDERQPRGRRPLARRCRAAEAGRSGGDDCSRWGRPTTLLSLSFDKAAADSLATDAWKVASRA